MFQKSIKKYRSMVTFVPEADSPLKVADSMNYVFGQSVITDIQGTW